MVQYSPDSMSHRGRQGRRPWPRPTAALIAVSILVPGLSDIKGGHISDAFVLRATDARSLTRCGAMDSVGGARVRCSHLQSSRPVGARRGVFYRRSCRRQAEGPLYVTFEGAGVEAASEGGGMPEGSFEGDEDMGMAPVDMDQAMGSFSPQWANDTERPNPRDHLIKGSVIMANQTIFPYPIESFPPRVNSEVYYNGTSARYWWNQDSDSVCVYVPVAKGFDVSTVEFAAKTNHVSLKLAGEEILSGTPFYRIDGYESLYVVDIENEPPYVQLELYKFREYQNWEDFLIEGSPWTPGGVG